MPSPAARVHVTDLIARRDGHVGHVGEYLALAPDARTGGGEQERSSCMERRGRSARHASTSLAHLGVGLSVLAALALPPPAAPARSLPHCFAYEPSEVDCRREGS